MRNLNKVLCMLLFFFSAGSQAGLIGDTVLVEYKTDRFLLGSKSVLISPQIDLWSWNSWTFDFTDNGLIMYSMSNTGYTSGNSFVFSSLDFGSSLILSGVTVEGIDQNRVSFTDNSVSLDFGWLGFSNTQQIRLAFETTGVPVPESSALVLLLTSLLGLITLRSRKISWLRPLNKYHP